jgi:ABC-type Zn uptake system ZnuABC Zn-binding protein ZnuA
VLTLRTTLTQVLRLLPVLAWVWLGTTANAAPLGAVATITPLGWLLEMLGGERVSVSVLVPAGGSPHAFEPRPRDLRALSDAKLFVAAGAGVDDWATRLAVAEGPRPLVLAHSDLGAHFWLDPIAVRDQALPILSEALAELDPAGRAHYSDRRRTVAHELTSLDAEIRASLAGIRRRPLIPMHAAFGAFAARYGVPLLEPVQQVGAEEPSPRSLARLADAAAAGGAFAVLVEPQLPAAASAALAETLGVPAVVVDALGDPAQPARGSYAALLRFDASAFRQALEGGS